MSTAEYSREPDAIVVHDPVEAGSLRIMDGISLDELQATYLYRSQPDDGVFAQHHGQFVETVADRVTQVYYLADLLDGTDAWDGLAANPNQVYTRDAIITLPTAPGRFLEGRMFSPIRRREPHAMRTALESLGFEALRQVPDGMFLEGGDVIPFAAGDTRTLLVGYGRRTTRAAADFLFDALSPEFIDDVIAIELAEWRINLDGALVPLAEDVAIAQPDSLLSAQHITRAGTQSVDVLSILRDVGMTIVDVSIDESIYQQACNCLCLGNRQIICYDLCPRAIERLSMLDVKAHPVPGSELVKGRGGPRCMSRPLYQRI